MPDNLSGKVVDQLENAIDSKISQAIKSITQTRDKAKVVGKDDDGTIWVSIYGGVSKTPVENSPFTVSVGDIVDVEIHDGKAWVIGNSTDIAGSSKETRQASEDAKIAYESASNAEAEAAQAAYSAQQAKSAADVAQASANAASNALKSVVAGATTVEKAVSVMQTALEAVVDYDPDTDTTSEYFWHDADGAHVLGDTSGYRNDIDSSGMDIVQVSTEDSVAHFGASGARIGKSAEIAASIEKNGFSLRSDEGNGGDPFFSVTMPYSPQGSKVAFMELIGSFTTFPATIRMRYTDDQDVTHDIGSVRDLYALRVSGHDSMPLVEQDVVLVVDYSGGLDGNGGVLPDYVTAYDDAAHTITVDRVGELADVLDAHPYATIEGVVVDSIAYEQPRMLFNVDEAGSLYADYRSLQLIDKGGSAFFHVSDLRDASGIAHLSARFNGDGTTTVFWISPVATNIGYSITVYNGSDSVVTAYILDKQVDRFEIECETAPYTSGPMPLGYYAIVEYDTISGSAKAMTFGLRESGSGVGALSVAEGYGVDASGELSHAEGWATTASGANSHSEGGGTAAIGRSSHAEGYSTRSRGDYSHAEGRSTVTDGYSEFVSRVPGTGAHAEGVATAAYGPAAHAEGDSTVAYGGSSHAQNLGSRAAFDAQTALGTYNAPDPAYQTATFTADGRTQRFAFYQGAAAIVRSVTVDGEDAAGYYNVVQASNEFGIMFPLGAPDNGSEIVVRYVIPASAGHALGMSYGTYAAIIGNGTSDTNRSNALAVDWIGNVRIAGEVQDMSGSQLYADASHTHSEYAAASHNHAASAITSGTLGVARGGTGVSTLGAGLVYHSASGTGALSIATAANVRTIADECKVLFSGTAATTVTLSETAANFTLIVVEIVLNADANRWTTVVTRPGAYTTFATQVYGSSKYWLKGGTVRANGTSCALTQLRSYELGAASTSADSNTEISRVWGIR